MNPIIEGFFSGIEKSVEISGNNPIMISYEFMRWINLELERGVKMEASSSDDSITKYLWTQISLSSSFFANKIASVFSDVVRLKN